ncbi:MAG: HdeD family acid-resistance protein [Chloroflexota bacterium]
MAATNAMNFETRRAPWWLGVIGGGLNILLGLLLLTVPVKTVLVLVLALGYYWIFSGISTLVHMFIDRQAWGWKLFSGALSILAGIYVLRYPLISAVTIPAVVILFLGIQGLIVGVLTLVMAFKGGGWASGIMGVLSMAFGAILVANYASLSSVVSLVWIVAILSLSGGIIQVIQAFAQRKE